MANGEQRCRICAAAIPAGQTACASCLAAERSTVLPDASVSPTEPLARTVGEFRILRTLGSGGMGTVYEAYQESMHRKVALKVLPPGLAIDGSGVQRFEREAWIAGRLNHPNIVKVYGQGSAAGTHFIAMELVEGASLHSEIRKAAEERRTGHESDSKWRGGHIRRMVEQFVGVADALHYVHQHGVVHRDIKPMNLLWDHEGQRLLLTDFGLARDADASRLTVQGDFMGTIRYMSPEQLLANRTKIDHRSDIWSLGVSLFEALTLDLPYSAPTEEGYIAAIGMKEPAPARKRDPAVPKDLETVLIKCLARDPDRRYQSAADLKHDLERYLAGLPVQARRPGLTLKAAHFLRRHAIAASAALVLTVGAGLVTTWYVRQQTFYSAMERVLALLEQQGAGASADAKLTPEEKRLREAFIAGRLRTDQTRRFAQVMVNPRILVSDYVARELPGNGIRFQVNSRSDYRWNFLVVTKRTVRAGDAPIVSDMGPQYRQPLGVPAQSLASVPDGRHRLDMQVITWIFDETAHRRAFQTELKDKSGMRITRGTIDGVREHPTTGKLVVHDGKEDVSWDEYWARMLKQTPPLWIGELGVSKEFQLVEELPELFPLAVSSPSLDAAMNKALLIDRFYFQPGAVCFALQITAPLPAPVSGRLDIATATGERLTSEPLTFRQGEASGYTSCVEIESPGPEWKVPQIDASMDRFGSWKTKNASPQNMWYRIEHGEKIGVIAAFRASRDVARTIPGLNSYWDGSLEFRGIASPEIPRR